MTVNVRGVCLGRRQVIPAMAHGGGGSIVLRSPLGGLRGMAKMSAYIAARHAVVGLMKTAALACAPLNIRVNAINPSRSATRMITALEKQFAPGRVEPVQARLAASVRLRRSGQPAEVARLGLFLASDESSYGTGANFPIHGGMSAA